MLNVEIDGVVYVPKEPQARRYRVGDLVRLVMPIGDDGWPVVGTYAIVKHIDARGGGYALEFIHPFEEGHDCDGNTRYGYGWWAARDDFELVERA